MGKETRGEAMSRILERYSGKKIEWALKDCIQSVLDKKDNYLRQIVQRMCGPDINTVSEITLAIFILDVANRKEWLDLLMRILESEDGSIFIEMNLEHISQNFYFGVCLGIFKIANELTEHHANKEEDDFLIAIPEIIYEIITSHGCLLNKTRRVLSNINSCFSPGESNEFRSALTKEIYRYMRWYRQYKDEGGLIQSKMDPRRIMEKMGNPDKLWREVDKYNIGGLILDQICYAIFGDSDLEERVQAIHCLVMHK